MIQLLIYKGQDEPAYTKKQEKEVYSLIPATFTISVFCLHWVLTPWVSDGVRIRAQ